MDRVVQRVEDGVGIAVGGGTASYAFLKDITTVAESIGIIAGAILTVLILFRWVYTNMVRNLFRAGESSKKEVDLD